MALTKRELVTWVELIQLVAQMTLAAVAALKDDDPVDFDAVKIRVTPEEALRRAQAEAQQKADSSPASAGSE
ncbi:MAG: hypothetical protein A3D93_05685 [Acidobacteria bacterium RIFCSPHIGHO2_12_FULL_67_30]|nr:MAG: hypothetical protein A2620_06530 [Acidobacteria bacterium RIFCSPHIGHO2_01_FULL_67_28]OFV88839.1 MAG: hypothetical protein A3D93_05685 [Acidobacteria bacterium RIFCSPHIGHO2_12_FULL_67_30]